MEFKAATISQYRAALAMLEQAIGECPEAMWNAPDPPNRFWQVAYHSLFYTHLYLSESLDSFKPWPRHIEGYEALGHMPNSSEPPEVETLSKEVILEYLEFCQNEVTEKISTLNVEAPSGFHWLAFDKVELQYYNIRHLVLHTGELCERLGTRAGIDVNWVGKDPGQ